MNAVEQELDDDQEEKERSTESKQSSTQAAHFFVDTNILAYAYDQSEKRKRRICSELVRTAFEGESNAYVSNQILGELFLVLTKKVAKPLSKEKASTIVRGLIDSQKWKKVTYDHSTIRKVLDDVHNLNVPFWDLLIAETMKDTGVTLLYTKNTKDFSEIPWVSAVNPVAEKK